MRRLLAAQIDELGRLEAALAPHLKTIARVELLRKLIRIAHDDAKFPAEQEIQAEGQRYTAVLGRRGNQTLIDIPRLVRTIKAAAFAKFATCTLGVLKEKVSAAIYADVTSIEATGHRSLTTFVKAAAK